MVRGRFGHGRSSQREIWLEGETVRGKSDQKEIWSKGDLSIGRSGQREIWPEGSRLIKIFFKEILFGSEL